MVMKFNEIEPMKIEAPRNGSGTGLAFIYEIVRGLDGKIKAFNHMRLHPNSAIGFHQHIDDLEIYLITEGNGIYNDNGEEVQVTNGDIMLCNKGEHHGLKALDKDLDFVAIIIG